MTPRMVMIIGLVTVASATPVGAQTTDVPRLEVFGGYSGLPAGGDDFPRPDSHGVLIDAAGNLTPWFGVVGELAWYRGATSDLGPNFPGQSADTRVRQALVGARFTARGRTVNAFVHGLVGSSTGDAGPDFEGFSDSGFTFGAGGGGDIHLDRRFAIRGRLDWIGSFADIVETNLRFAIGGVMRF